jgi:hypothetical protein
MTLKHQRLLLVQPACARHFIYLLSDACIFEAHEYCLRFEELLADACIPQLRQAIKYSFLRHLGLIIKNMASIILIKQ